MDRRTDRILITIPRLHYMQRGKNCVLWEDGSSYRRHYIFIYATSAFTKTLLSERRGTNV